MHAERLFRVLVTCLARLLPPFYGAVCPKVALLEPQDAFERASGTFARLAEQVSVKHTHMILFSLRTTVFPATPFNACSVAA